MTRITEDMKTDWFPHDMKPSHKGYYEVGSDPALAWSSSSRLTGRPSRYWDGTQWLAFQGGHGSIFGTHTAHCWRGLKEPMSC